MKGVRMRYVGKIGLAVACVVALMVPLSGCAGKNCGCNQAAKKHASGSAAPDSGKPDSSGGGRGD